MNLVLLANWETYLLLLGAVLALNGLLLRSAAVSWLDPLFFVALQSSIALVTVLFSRFTREGPGDGELALVGLEHAAFAAAFILAARRARTIGDGRAASVSGADPEARGASQLLWVLRLSTGILIAVLLARLLGSGLFMFAADPELARTEARSSGLGYLYRLTHALSIVSVAALAGLAVQRQPVSRGLRWVGWGLPVFLTVTTGSKSEIILLYAAAFFAVYALRGAQVTLVVKPRVAWGLALATLGMFFFAATRRFSVVTVEADSPLDYATAAFLERIADAGAGLTYYLTNDPPQDLARLGPIDFLWNNLLAPFLGPFGLASYPPTLGKILAREMTGDETFGPNPTMYMEGLVYWGAVGAVAYCGLLGAGLAAMRGLFPVLRRHTTLSPAMALLVSSYWAAIALNVTVDVGLITFGLFNFVFIVIPVLLAAHAASGRDRPPERAEGPPVAAGRAPT